MFAALYVDGALTAHEDETCETVSVEFDPNAGATHQCRVCGEPLIETVDGYETVYGELTCDDADGPTDHDPERIPLSWCNSAGVQLDEAQDAVTVLISVGDPRGAFAFTVRRIPDDVEGDLAGQLVLDIPHPGEHMPHMALSALRAGTYLVGSSARAIKRAA